MGDFWNCLSSQALRLLSLDLQQVARIQVFQLVETVCLLDDYMIDVEVSLHK